MGAHHADERPGRHSSGDVADQSDRPAHGYTTVTVRRRVPGATLAAADRLAWQQALEILDQQGYGHGPA